jgi:hypothetical protein
MTMREIIEEHNALNGYRLVLVEFALVAAAAIFLSVAAARERGVLRTVAALGVAANAVAVCATTVAPLRRGERGEGLVATLSGEGRRTARSRHPDLGRHTLRIVAATLFPFLLVGLLILKC